MNTIILFGDSIPAGTNDTITHPDQKTGRQLQILTGFHVIDLSWPGMRVCRDVDPNSPLVKYCGIGILDGINILDQLPAPSGVYVIIQRAINDVKNGTPRLTLKSEVKAIVERIKALGLTPILISPTPEYNINPDTDMYNDTRVDFESIAVTHGCIHLSGKDVIDYTNPDLYAAPDTQHLSPLGNQYMAHRICDLMVGRW